MNALADADPEALRISMDTKATVDIGEYSGYGRSRGLVPVKAWDHDMRPKEKLIPGGILEPVSGRSILFFTDSYKTSDFMVDGLMLWWGERKFNGIGRVLKSHGTTKRWDRLSNCTAPRTSNILLFKTPMY